jgi:hypothetical protein
MDWINPAGIVFNLVMLIPTTGVSYLAFTAYKEMAEVTR